jgi:hypothetical protein
VKRVSPSFESHLWRFSAALTGRRVYFSLTEYVILHQRNINEWRQVGYFYITESLSTKLLLNIDITVFGSRVELDVT